MDRMIRHRPGHRDERGFTLIEMITTLFVASIIMAFAIPTIHRQIATNTLRASAREVASVLRSARDAALNEGTPRYVLFEPPRRYTVFRYTSSGWQRERVGKNLPRSVSFESGDVTFPQMTNTPPGTTATVPARAAYFDTRGRYPSGEPGPFTIRLRGGAGQTITLTVQGQTGQVVGV